ncbi:hypothetical protein INR49_028121 [Caranx melampygus]|nr:hypothetical protein INR49_028121 [Caranx melampygus]
MMGIVMDTHRTINQSINKNNVVNRAKPFLSTVHRQCDLALVEIHFYHQESITDPGEAWGPAAVRSSHITGSIEVSKVVVSCKVRTEACNCFSDSSRTFPELEITTAVFHRVSCSCSRSRMG